MINPFANKNTDHNKRVVSTIIVSRPGVMRQSLRATLAGYPNIWVAAAAGDGLTALSHVNRHRPGLLVIDSNLLADEVETLLAMIKANAPAPRCLICIQSGQHEARLLAAGADAVILRDSSGPQWEETLFRLTQPAAL